MSSARNPRAPLALDYCRNRTPNMTLRGAPAKALTG
jgi:hypothetical protein